MTIDSIHFTPYAALLGGALIGLATALLLLLNGRIAGISGMVGAIFRPAKGELAWRLAFLLGLIGAPAVYSMLARMPAVQVEADYPTLAIAGLLVGLGTRYTGGCTSGHGVCGLSRRSPRSAVATVAFMCSGFATLFVVRHVIGL